MAKHITDIGAAKVKRTARKMNGPSDDVAGPSPNPTTNAIIHDIALRSVGRIARQTFEKGLLARRYGVDFAKEAVESRSLVQTLTAYGITKVATRSVPGALAVGGALLAKTLFDRSQSRRKAKRAGDKAMRDVADQE